ncbi:MAG: hypothetical protein E7452_02685 [Ruminococcaceae bacterium]|nr:hypothetical protein [Oscillospiraceae bacterium]
MKKLRFLWFAAAMLLLAGAFCGCGAGDVDVPTEDKVHILAGGERIVPHVHFVNSMTWDGEHFLAADAFGFSFSPEVSLPTLVYADDLMALPAEGIETGTRIRIVDFETRAPIFRSAEISSLEVLPAGKYYAAMFASQKGRYIEEMDRYESTNYECAFILELPDRGSAVTLSAEQPICIRTDVEVIVPYSRTLRVTPPDGGAVQVLQPSIYGELAAYETEFPTIAYAEDLAIECLASVAGELRVTVLDAETQTQLFFGKELSALGTLPAGRYYVYFQTEVYDLYAESDAKTGDQQNEYVFCLTVA